MAKLIPVDLEQCQAEKKVGCWPTAHLFMSLGPAQLVRCNNKPTWIATEKKPPKGSMALCDCCKAKCIEQMGTNFATYKRTQEQKEGAL